MNKREVSKDFMINLIRTETPKYNGVDDDGIMHLKSSIYDFVYTPFGQIVASNSRTGISYICYGHEFSLMYEGIRAERMK